MIDWARVLYRQETGRELDVPDVFHPGPQPAPMPRPVPPKP